LNEAFEEESIKSDDSDFSTVMKVDNHIHAAAAMTLSEMLTFIRSKWVTEADVIVLENGTSLHDCMVQCGISDPSKLTTEKLEMSGNSSKIFHRFDSFNDTYNPMGKADLRTVFMKTENKIGGRYFAPPSHNHLFRNKTMHSISF
jgi:AMP deaminase